jgi:hypothetical protein
MTATAGKATFRTSSGTNNLVRAVIGQATADRGGDKPSADAVIAAAFELTARHWPEFLKLLSEQRSAV